MTSISQLKREMEIVRRALGSTQQQESYRKEAEEANRIFGSYERTLESAVAELTDEGARELRRSLTEDPKNFDEACSNVEIRNVLSYYYTHVAKRMSKPK